jgi:outer membrane protein
MLKSFRLLSSTILSLSLLAGPALADDAPIMTLEQALNIVRTQNLQVKNADIQVNLVGDQKASMQANLYPELSAGVRGYHNFEDNSFTFSEGSLGTVGGNPVPSSNVEIATTDGFSTRYSITAKQPLIQLYEINLNVDKLSLEQDIARHQLRGTRQSVSWQLKQLYYQILSYESSMESTKSSIAFYSELVEILKDQVAQKTELEYQLLNAQAELASSKHDLVTQKNNIVTSKQQLNALLDRDISTPFSVSMAFDDPLLRYTEKTAEEQALANSPETAEARLQIKVAETNVEIQKTDYYPDLDLVASYGKSQGTEFIPDESIYVGLFAKWDFYTWGQNESNVSGTKRALSQAINSLRDSEDQVRAQVSEDIRNLKVAKELVPVTRLAQKAAAEKLRVNTNQYKAGAILLDDLLDAEYELSQANDNYHQAQLAVWNASAELEKDLGEE